MEQDGNVLLGFFNLSKGALISEFSVQDFYSNMENNNIFLDKHIMDYKAKIEYCNMEQMINNAASFDENKMIFSNRNFLPMNFCKIYQPIDSKTNNITIYDAENESFTRLELIPDKQRGFFFLPYSRHLNFGGKVFISGGFEGEMMSKKFWAVDEIIVKNEKDTSDLSPFGVTNQHFYETVNPEAKYPDVNQDYMLIECSNMIHARVGHTMLGLAPSIIFAFGGIRDNKSCEMFHVDNNRWEEISPLNASRTDASAFIYKNFIYIFGGFQYDHLAKRFKFLDSFEKLSLLSLQSDVWKYYVPRINSSESTKSFALARSLAGIAIKSDSIIYICGGQVDKNKYSDEIFELNLEMNVLNLINKKLPKPSGFLERNFISLFRLGINFDISGDIFYYDSSNDRFSFHFKKLKNS